MAAGERWRAITPQEYLAAEQHSEQRNEYWDGVIVAMAGGSRSHNRIIRNMNRCLSRLLDGSACEPFSSETRVRVAECNTYFYSDALIVCGEAEYEETETETLLNPTVIIEVLSPSTEAADRGRKFACYRTLPSLHHYILIAQDAPTIDLYTRQPDETWLLRDLTGIDAVLTLDTPSLGVPLAEIYRAIEFPPRLHFAAPDANA